MEDCICSLIKWYKYMYWNTGHFCLVYKKTRPIIFDPLLKGKTFGLILRMRCGTLKCIGHFVQVFRFFFALVSVLRHNHVTVDYFFYISLLVYADFQYPTSASKTEKNWGSQKNKITEPVNQDGGLQVDRRSLFKFQQNTYNKKLIRFKVISRQKIGKL